MFENFAADSRLVVVGAQQAAHELRHNPIGTRHLLLALMKVGDPIVDASLSRCGVSYEPLLQRVTSRWGRGADELKGALPFDVFARKALEEALRQAEAEQTQIITPVHLLFGLMAVSGSDVSLLLLDLGTSQRDVSNVVRRLRSQ